MESIDEPVDTTCGLCCLGWAEGGQKEDENGDSSKEEEEDGDGEKGGVVGGDRLSWGVDLGRCIWLHSGTKGPFGRRWRAGDVLGLACELPQAAGPSAEMAAGGKMLVSVNGDFSLPFGTAFNLPAGLSCLFPVLSSAAGRLRVNLGGAGAPPLQHAPPAQGYLPMGDLASPEALASSP